MVDLKRSPVSEHQFEVQTEDYGLLVVDIQVWDNDRVTSKVRHPEGMSIERYEGSLGSGSWSDDYDLNDLEKNARRHVFKYLGVI